MASRDDDLRRQAQREAVLRAAASAEASRLAREARSDAPELPTPAGTGALSVERRQGQWRTYLCGERLRVGDPLEVYLNPAVGWVRGTYQWGRRNISPPKLRVEVTHPDDAARPLGEVELDIPGSAVCRHPEESIDR